MVQVLPGTGEQLAPAIDAFAQGLEKYLKPNHDFQIAMQKAIGGNPQLAQQLADLEYNAPGTLSRMGFGDLGHVISQIPESEKSQFLRTSRGEILATDKQKLQAESTQTGFDLDRLNETINFLKDPKNQTINADLILRMLTGQTSGQRAQTAADTKATETSTKHVEAETKALETKQPLLEAQTELDLKGLQDHLDHYTTLHGMDPMQMINDMMKGKSVPGLQSYMATPEGVQALNLAKSIQEAQARRDEQFLLKAQFSHAVSAEEKANIQNAASLIKTTRTAGSIAAARVVLEHPEQVEELRKKEKEDPSSLSMSERMILRVDDAHAEQLQRQDYNQVQKMNIDLRLAHQTAATAVKNAESPAGIAEALAPLNNILAIKANQTGQLYTARYGPLPDVGSSTPGKHWYGGEVSSRLYYTDASGKRVADEIPFVEPQVNLNDQARANAFIMQYNAANAKDQKFNLDELKKSKPSVYEIVKGVLKLKD